MTKRIFAALLAVIMMLGTFTAFATDAADKWVYNGNGTHAKLDAAGNVIESGTCNYVASEVPVTCLYGGFTVYTCPVCLHSYKNNYVTAVGHHEFSSWIPNHDSTFTEDGTETRTCLVCAEQETRTQKGSAIYKWILGTEGFNFDLLVKAVKTLGGGLVTWVKIIIGFVK